MTKSDALRGWALKGAAARLEEILGERAAIHRAFPELRRRGTPALASEPAPIGDPKPKRTRGKRGMSAAQRKAVGDRMRKYWASRRAGG